MKGSMAFLALGWSKSSRTLTFSEIYNPSLTSGPSQLQLLEMVYKARNGKD